VTTTAPSAPTVPVPAVREAADTTGLHLAGDVDAHPILTRIALDAEYFPVLTDCGDVEDYGQVVPTACDLRLCAEHAATHTCHDCDIAARDGGED
jgi:hypothetical protein